MMLSDARIAAALFLMGCSAACGPTDGGRPDPAEVAQAEGAGPTLPYVVEDVCPGEGCAFGTWLACGSVPGYAEVGDRSTEVFRLSRDESFAALTGQMRVAAPWLVVVTATTPIRSRQQEPTAFVAGDTLYVLHYVGEGSFNVWYRGAEVQTRAFWVEEGADAARDRLSQEATTEYWVEAETSAGQRGWVLAEERLVARENLRDPDAPWCPNREP